MYQDINDLFNQKQVLAEAIFEYDALRNSKLKAIKNKYLQDALFTLRFLTISLSVNEPLLFVNYMKWFGTLAYYLEFNYDAMKNHFDACETIFKKKLNDQLYLELMKTWEPGISDFKASFYSEKSSSADYDEFLNLLINMDSDKAYRYVLDLIESGMSLKEVYLNLLQPTLYQVGELWQRKIITVAKEHYITAAIQHIIGKLYPILFADKKVSSHTITAVCAGEELHEIGMRMIADFFELAGWDSIFLGSNIPINIVVQQLVEHPTDVLAISATTPSHLMEVRKLIQTVKDHPSLDKILIMVGGKVFNDTPHLWQSIGADAFATEPEQAILLANLHVGELNV